MDLKKIALYYDKTLPFYEAFWHRGKSYAIHYGYWDKKTKNHQEALINQNKFMASKIKPRDGLRILDAGCGIGGSALWLAQRNDVKITGITLSDRQVSKARELAQEHGLADKITFEVQNYMKTKFKDKSFDVVWGLESICYADSKKTFLKEAYRVLKPGGKIIIADGLLLRNLRDDEREDYQRFIDGFVLPNLSLASDFKKWMEEVGFKSVKYWNTTMEAEPSSRIMYRRVAVLHPLAKLLNRLGLVSDMLIANSEAGLAQRRLVKNGAAGYGAFYGEK